MRFGPSSNIRGAPHGGTGVPPRGPPPPSLQGDLTEMDSENHPPVSSSASARLNPHPSAVSSASLQARGAWSARPGGILDASQSFAVAGDSTRKRVKQGAKLVVKRVQGDGNCLFRSVCAQVYGDDSWHDKVREECADFMSRDRDHFRDFVDGDFDDYLAELRRPGTFGDNPEIQAIAELYNRPVVVFTVEDEDRGVRSSDGNNEAEILLEVDGTVERAKRLNIFHNKYEGSESAGIMPIQLLYRGGSHYDAVIDPYAAVVGVGLGLAGFEPGKAERDLVEAATIAADVEATEKEMERAVLAASLQDALPSSTLFRSSSSTSSSASATGFKKMRKTHPDPPRDCRVVSVSSSSKTDPPTHTEQLPPAVRELVLNGFDLEKVLVAHAVAGDSFEDMLTLLMTSENM